MLNYGYREAGIPFAGVQACKYLGLISPKLYGSLHSSPR